MLLWKRTRPPLVPEEGTLPITSPGSHPSEAGGRKGRRKPRDTAPVVNQHLDPHACVPELLPHLHLIVTINVTIPSTPWAIEDCGRSHVQKLKAKANKFCDRSTEGSPSLLTDGLLPCLGAMKPRKTKAEATIPLVPGRNEDFCESG